MPRTINGIATRLEAITREVQDTFGSLSVAQLHWKPAPDRWSIAECLDHLMVTNKSYFRSLRALSDGSYRHTVWQRVSPMSGFWGRFLIRSLDPANTRRTKTLSKARPVVSGDDSEVVNRFVAQQSELASSIRRLPPNTDLDDVVLTSPLMSLITYSLRDALEVVIVHEQRHLQQARRVMEVPGFPNHTDSN
jgi:hypothetical protein